MVLKLSDGNPDLPQPLSKAEDDRGYDGSALSRPHSTRRLGKQSSQSEVCGEVVVRGDECVSLGWCFWHRACYGCLLCGNKLVAQGLGLEKLFTDEKTADNDARTAANNGKRVWPGTEKGREIDQIPLCANCAAEVEADQLDEKSVVQKGLRRIDQTDDGMCRRRWEDGHWNFKEEVSVTKKALPSQQRTRHQRSVKNGPNARSSYDGADCESAAKDNEQHQEMGYPIPDEPSAIYVSMTDPLGQPAFRPSPTKPIPQWMQVRNIPTANESLNDHNESNPVLGSRSSWPCSNEPDVSVSRGNDYQSSVQELSTAYTKSSAGNDSTRANLIANDINDRVGSVERSTTVYKTSHPRDGTATEFHSARQTSGREQRPRPVSGQHTGQKLPARRRAGSNRSSYASTICPKKSTSWDKIPACDSRPVVYKRSSIVVDEPLILPSSLMPALDVDKISINTIDTHSAYSTPPEYPSPPGSGGRVTPESVSEACESPRTPPRLPGSRRSSVASMPKHASSRELQLEISMQPKTRHSMASLQDNSARHSPTRAQSTRITRESSKSHAKGKTLRQSISYVDSAGAQHNDKIVSTSYRQEAGNRPVVTKLRKKNPRAEEMAAPTVVTRNQVGGMLAGRGKGSFRGEGGQDGSSSPTKGKTQVLTLSRKASIVESVGDGASKGKRTMQSELKRLFGR
ncbi:hypothetical protein V8F06_004740 [Rhypophila decipiens]